jgi:hypothetical protein
VHVVAEGQEGRLLGGLLCLPADRRGDERCCPLGWLFSDATLSVAERERISDALVERAHEEASKLGFEAVLTSLGSKAAADFMSRRHGYLPASFGEREDRWTASLAAESETEPEPEPEPDSATSSERMTWQKTGDQLARYATADIKNNDVIVDLKRTMKRVERASANTLQLAEGFHYQAFPEPLRLNHNCSPNGYMCFEDLTYRALRDISEGEELTFHYCTTEFEMINPFDCLCGSPECLGWVGGYKHLDEAQVERLSSLVSPILMRKR